MKVLIVGGTSMLGIALKPVLSGYGEVITAGRKNCDVYLDLDNDVENMHIPNDMDVIIHAVANFGGETDAEILNAENINVLGTLKVCQLAVRAKARHLVMISSIYSCLDEKSDYYNVYALSKRHAEELARLYCSSHSLPLAILRPSQIYGDSESFKRHQPFFYTIINRIANGEDVLIYGSHDPQRNFIHVEDLTMIILKVALNRIEGTFSCTHPKNVTFSEIANAAILAFKCNGNVLFLKDKADISDNIFLNDITLYKKINFYPQISIEEGVKRIAHFRENGL